MKQLYFIILREIRAKLKSPSFYIFAFFTPVLFILPIVFSVFTGKSIDKTQKYDKVGLICNQFPYDTVEYRNLKFFSIDGSEVNNIKKDSFDYSNCIGVIDMRNASFYHPHNIMNFKMYTSENNITFVQQHINDIESFINSEYVYQYGIANDINETELLKLTNFIRIIPIYNKNTQSNIEHMHAKVIAFGLGMLFYIMFILFNNNIVRSIAEEKSNKLAEVLSMFVSPQKLMTGKIIGLSLSSLIQLIIWITSFAIYNRIVMIIGRHYGYVDPINDIYSVDFGKILFSEQYIGWLLLFFFLGVSFNGIISTILAILSSKRGSSSTMILSNMLNLISIYFGMYAVTNPNSNATLFTSYFPFTSYLVMPTIVPLGVSFSSILLSATFLIIISILLLLIIGKLYRRFLA